MDVRFEINLDQVVLVFGQDEPLDDKIWPPGCLVKRSPGSWQVA